MIDLRPITPQNQVEARKLAVRQDQQRFIASVDSSLADAFIWDSIFRVAFKDGLPVGFILLFPFERDRKRLVNVVRLMVDARYQGRGLGRKLLSATLDYIKTITPPYNNSLMRTQQGVIKLACASLPPPCRAA